MKTAIRSENLGRVQEDENFLFSKLLDNAELMVKANEGLELDEVEQFKLDQLYQAHVSQSFHNYIRIMETTGNLKVPPRVFADTLRTHPAFMGLWEAESPSKDRLVMQWQEHVQEFIGRDA